MFIYKEDEVINCYHCGSNQPGTAKDYVEPTKVTEICSECERRFTIEQADDESIVVNFV